MRDEDDGRAVFPLQIVHQTKYLRLDSNVKSRCGLVGDQDLRAAGKRHSDHNALAHTAGKLVRILLYDGFRVRDLHVVKHFERLLCGFLFGHMLMDDERLAELTLDRENGVERGHRLLEYNGYLVAADIVHLLLGELCEVGALKKDLAAGDISVAVKQLEYAHCRHALARSGLADDADGLLLVKRIGNVVYRFDYAFSRFEIGVKVLNFQ